MTLIVSLRIPDGIVIAGDSLATMMSQMNLVGEVNVKCPQCEHEHTVGPVPVGQLTVPSTTYSYAQKVFSLFGKYGVGTYGAGQLSGKTIYFAMRELEEEVAKTGGTPDTVLKVAEMIGERALNLLKAQMPDIDTAEDDWHAVGFQVVGYDGPDARTFVVDVGKSVKTKERVGPGCTIAGQRHVVEAMWGLYKQRPQDQAQYSLFSLQDAIAYAEFLIGTTASYQKFSRSIPQVGGEIDIALVTPFDKFKWIRQKELGKILGG